MSVSEADPISFADNHFFLLYFFLSVFLDGFTSSTDTSCVWRQQGNDTFKISKKIILPMNCALVLQPLPYWSKKKKKNPRNPVGRSLFFFLNEGILGQRGEEKVRGDMIQ